MKIKNQSVVQVCSNIKESVFGYDRNYPFVIDINMILCFAIIAPRRCSHTVDGQRISSAVAMIKKRVICHEIYDINWIAGCFPLCPSR